MEMVEMLASLAHRLNILNIQFVADGCGISTKNFSKMLAETEIQQLSSTIANLKDRIEKCHSTLVLEMERLSSTKVS
jgi:hypothetical protein